MKLIDWLSPLIVRGSLSKWKVAGDMHSWRNAWSSNDFLNASEHKSVFHPWVKRQNHLLVFSNKMKWNSFSCPEKYHKKLSCCKFWLFLIWWNIFFYLCAFFFLCLGQIFYILLINHSFLYIYHSLHRFYIFKGEIRIMYYTLHWWAVLFHWGWVSWLKSVYDQYLSTWICGLKGCLYLSSTGSSMKKDRII